MSESMIKKTEHEMRIIYGYIMHYILLPAILIGSDLFIGFMGHYSGTTGNLYTWETFMEYLKTLTIGDILPILIIATAVVLIVEVAGRYKHTKPKKQT